MNPLRLSATGYRTFASLDVDLPAGCAAIVGPNGAGKSSILNLVDVALFADRGELPALLTSGEDHLELAVEFEHAGELYRVRRSYSAAGRGKTTLDFERCEQPTALDRSWEPLTRENTAQTQELINATVGLSRTTFRASSFLRQGDGAAFTEAQPRDRKAILAEILGLDLWDRLLDKARVDLRGVQDQLAGSVATAEQLQQQVAQEAAVAAARDEAIVLREAAQAAVAEGEQELEVAQQHLTKVRAAAERIEAARQQAAVAERDRARATAALDEAQQAQRALDDARIELDDAQADAARVPQLEAELERRREAGRVEEETQRRRQELRQQLGQRELALERLMRQADTLAANATELDAKADHLDAHIHEAGDCDRCGQKLGAEAAARAAASFRQEAATVRAGVAEMNAAARDERAALDAMHAEVAALPPAAAIEDPKPTAEKLAAARAAAERRGALEERIRQLAEVAARREALEAEAARAAQAADASRAGYESAREGQGDEQAATRAVERAQAVTRQARALLEQRVAEVARTEQQLEQIAVAASQLATLEAISAELLQRQDLLKLAERAYGRDGIPALIVENAAIPQIEVEANRILGELGGGTADCRIELRTQRALKTTEALRETLDIVIRTPAGDRPYETFSGGERTRLNLALRIALARLLAHRRGAESRLLAIDEPEFLDEHGVARLADVLRGLAGDFDRVLLVSHHPGLAASFDRVIEVCKDGDRSRVDGSREEVAA